MHLFKCSTLNHLLGQILSFLVWWRSRPSLPEGWRSPKIVIASLSSHGKQRAEAQTAPRRVTITSNLVFLLYWSHLPERTYSFKCKADGIDQSLGREVLQQVIKNVPLNREKESAEMREARQSGFATLTAGSCEC